MALPCSLGVDRLVVLQALRDVSARRHLRAERFRGWPHIAGIRKNRQIARQGQAPHQPHARRDARVPVERDLPAGPGSPRRR